MTLFSILAFGFLIGMKHATEADHLAAVATLATRSHSTWDALRQGAAWGLGHALTLMLFGGLVLGLGRSIPPQIEQGLELVVGLMLLALGFDVLRRLRRQSVHFHVHQHGDGLRHFHAHSHATIALQPNHAVPDFTRLQFQSEVGAHADLPHDHAHPARLPRRALLIGMVHGLAGSAALIVLSLEAAASVPMGLLYVLLFGAGSMLGMALLSVAIALPLRLSGGVLDGVHRGLTAGFGLLSCGMGLWLIGEMGSGLLAA